MTMITCTICHASCGTWRTHCPACGAVKVDGNRTASGVYPLWSEDRVITIGVAKGAERIKANPYQPKLFKTCDCDQ